MNLAKPTGITLKEHTENVIAQAEDWKNLRKQSFEKYRKFFKQTAENSLIKVCKYHDLGKKVKAWQSACWAEYENFKKHNKVSGEHLQRANIRHEIHSLLICEKNNAILSIEEKASIACHHGKLSRQHQDKWEKWQNGAGEKLWKSFKSLNFNSQNDSFEEIVRKSFQFDFLRAGLQLADKRASAIESRKQVPTRAQFHYEFDRSWKIRPVQSIAKENAKDLFIMLRAPTGAGKTDACLLWAKEQIEIQKRADRLVIAMPTRFTSNALGINISSSISQTGIYHSTAKFLKKEGIEGNHYASLLETPATVCTIDHLLYCLSKTKEDHHITFSNLANACLVIDEADFYDTFTQGNLLVLLEVLKVLEVPVLLMSASLPNSSLDYYRKSGYQIKGILEDESDLNRKRCHISELRGFHVFEDISDFLVKATKQPTIIYVNTVDTALKLGRWFHQNYKDIKVEVYHSRFTESDKIEKEKNLIAMLGKDAWQNNKAKGVAILTQIGEMSVNISADFMISEVCPMDRLVQRVGRLSRFDVEKVGELIVLYPHKDGQLYPAPYGTFKHGTWTANKFLMETIQILKRRSYSARDFNILVNLVYQDGLQLTDKAKSNAYKLRGMIRKNWLILPDYELDEEQESGHWKTRDITGQTNILTIQESELKSKYFESWSDLSELIHKKGINCPTYLIKANLKKGHVKLGSVIAKDEEVKLFFLSPSLEYNYCYGLDLSIPNEKIEDRFL